MTDERPTLKRFKEEFDFYELHHDELLEQYPEEWVAILDQAVVAADPNPETLIATLRQRGLPTERALVQHLTRHEETLILVA
jgi:Family of unknown function (DUF5678)